MLILCFMHTQTNYNSMRSWKKTGALKDLVWGRGRACRPLDFHLFFSPSGGSLSQRVSFSLIDVGSACTA